MDIMQFQYSWDNLYLGDVWFNSRPGQWLSWLKEFVVYLTLCRLMQDMLRPLHSKSFPINQRSVFLPFSATLSMYWHCHAAIFTLDRDLGGTTFLYRLVQATLLNDTTNYFAYARACVCMCVCVCDCERCPLFWCFTVSPSLWRRMLG
jgi:hypothetical protein